MESLQEVINFLEFHHKFGNLSRMEERLCQKKQENNMRNF